MLPKDDVTKKVFALFQLVTTMAAVQVLSIATQPVPASYRAPSVPSTSRISCMFLLFYRLSTIHLFWVRVLQLPILLVIVLYFLLDLHTSTIFVYPFITHTLSRLSISILKPNASALLLFTEMISQERMILV